MKDIEKLLKTSVDEICNHLGISPTVEITDDEEGYSVDIDGRDLSFLIGYRGESLRGLQHYLGLVVFHKLNEWHPVVVDINGYREARQEKIEDMARRAIDKLRFFREEVEMRPMTPYERRQIHIFVSDYDDVVTESAGEGRDRHVVLKLKS